MIFAKKRVKTFRKWRNSRTQAIFFNGFDEFIVLGYLKETFIFEAFNTILWKKRRAL